MSDALYLTRLWYDGKRGLAKHEGVLVELSLAPPVPVDHLREIDYWPSRGRLRVSAEAWREMTQAECAAVQAWLERIVNGARRCERCSRIAGEPTPCTQPC